MDAIHRFYDQSLEVPLPADCPNRANSGEITSILDFGVLIMAVTAAESYLKLSRPESGTDENKSHKAQIQSAKEIRVRALQSLQAGMG